MIILQIISLKIKGFSNIDTTTTPAPPKKLAKIHSVYSSDDLIVILSLRIFSEKSC